MNLTGGEIVPGASYEFCGVTAGEYRLELSSMQTEPHLEVAGIFTSVVVVGTEDVDLGPLILPGPGEVRGTVSVKGSTAGDSIPVGMRVRLVSRDDWRWYFYANNGGVGVVQADGTFQIARVFPGDYSLRADGLAAGYYLISALQRGRDVLAGGAHPGDGDLQITLGSDGATVTGRVLAADDAAVPDATVLLIPSDGGQPLMVQSDQAGAYRFNAGVRPGEYKLAAATDRVGSGAPDPVIAARIAANGIQLTLGPRESRTVDARVQSSR